MSSIKILHVAAKGFHSSAHSALHSVGNPSLQFEAGVQHTLFRFLDIVVSCAWHTTEGSVVCPTLQPALQTTRKETTALAFWVGTILLRRFDLLQYIIRKFVAFTLQINKYVYVLQVAGRQDQVLRCVLGATAIRRLDAWGMSFL